MPADVSRCNVPVNLSKAHNLDPLSAPCSTKRLQTSLRHFPARVFLSLHFCLPFSLLTKGHRSVSLLSCDVLREDWRLKGHKPCSQIKHSKRPPDQNSVHITIIAVCVCWLKIKKTDWSREEDKQCNVKTELSSLFLKHRLFAANYKSHRSQTATCTKRGGCYFIFTTLTL